MYITASTYGGIDWHDSRTIHEQLKSNGSYNIEKDKVPEAIADDIAKDFPYVEDIREKILQALSEKSNLHFMIKSGEKDSLGNVYYKESACYEDDGRIYYEAEADFDGEKQTLTRNLAFGQVSYITTYHVEDIPDENKLVEITDSRVLAHVDNLIPGLVQVGNLANNAKQAIQANSQVLYKAVIPTGAKLANSKELEGAVRGFYHGANGIGGHANFAPVKAPKGAVVANTAAAAMGVASMIVGQYYMTQINAELGEISDEISKIINFLDNEYRSRVFSLVAHVKEIADFQVEIVENNELRLSKISQLARLQEECAQLLGQANFALMGYTNKSDLDYATYEA